MASQTLKGFNRKYVASKQKIELPKFITEDELEDIIGQPPGYKTITRKRSSGRATSLAEVRKQASTPSPNQKKVASFFKARNSPYEEIDSGKRKLLRNTENLDANYTSKLSQLTNKYQRSKHKNTQMKEDIKMMQARYESELSILHKENEKLVQMNKRIRKDHLDQQETLHEEILHLRKDLDYAHTELYKYIGTFKNILENIISKQITLDNSQENLTSKINESITYFNSQVEQLVKRMPRYNFENCFIKLWERNGSTGETGEFAFRKTGSFHDCSDEYISPSETLVMNKPALIQDTKIFEANDAVTLLKRSEAGWSLGKLKERAVTPNTLVSSV